MMRPATRLQRHKTARLRGKKLQNLAPRKPSAENLPPRCIRAMRMAITVSRP
jgi:hypothetical protein